MALLHVNDDKENPAGSDTTLRDAPRRLVHGRYLKGTGRSITAAGLAGGSAIAPGGSVLLSNRAPIGYVANVKSPVAFNQGCKAVIPKAGYTPDFLAYVLRANADRLEALGQGTTFKELSAASLRTLQVPVPPAEHQELVARYLDRETAEIEAFIADQEQLIALLTERRAAAISRAVTKGLDPSAAMRDSGIAWAGHVPNHWNQGLLRRLIARIEQGVSPQAEQGLATEQDDVGVLTAGCVNWGVFRAEAHKRLPFGFQYAPSIEIRLGDLLVNRASGSVDLLGSAAIVDELGYRLILSDKIFRITPSYACDVGWLYWFLNSMPYRSQVKQSVSGAEGLASNLPMATLRGIQAFWPSIGEQRDIETYLYRETAEIDAAIADALQAIALSKERRAALITAAVTGHTEVSAGRQAREPEAAVA